MYKKATLSLFAMTLLLAGCGGVKDEFAKGEQLFQKGDYESLIEAREFFNDYAAKNPDDKDVNEYFAKVDQALIAEAKDMTKKAFENKEIEKAMEYVTVAKEGDPKDKETLEAYKTIKTAYDDQMNYNKFTDYLEERYIETKDITDQWDKAIKLIETGKANHTYAKDVAKVLYLDIVELRKIVNAQSFNLTGNGQSNFRDVNTELFNYLVNVERELSLIMSVNSVTSIGDYKDKANYITPKMFNDTFLRLQESTTLFVTEEDMEGNPIRNISDTLNFTEAYQKKLEDDKKAAEEAAAQQTAPATTTTP